MNDARPAGLLDLADARFVSLTTYRRSGAAVATPVWVAAVDGGAGGDALVVTTGASSGKVKRLRRDPRVSLRPCSRRGAVEPDAPTVTGVAEIIDDPATCVACTAAISRRYGVEFRIVMLLEKLFSRGSRERVILRITPAD